MSRDYQYRSFAPFTRRYTSISFASLVHQDANVSHIIRLLNGRNDSIAYFRFYLSLSNAIHNLERTLNVLYNDRNQVFETMTDDDFVRLIQPFLRHYARRTNRRPPQPSSSSSSSNRPRRYHTPPSSPPPHVIRQDTIIQDGSRDNPIVISRTPTPVPSTSRTQFTSPLAITLAPACNVCGGRNTHYRECTIRI